jgi:outer membrane protein FlgP
MKDCKMKFIMFFLALFVGSLAFGGTKEAKVSEPVASTTYVFNQTTNTQQQPIQQSQMPQERNSVTAPPVLSAHHPIRISVTGEGVAPINTTSPAQAYALAKRAAVVDAYRLIAEKVQGVKVEGHDLVRNMMIQRSSVRTSVYAMVRNANVVQTTFKDGLCEVEMSILISYSQFAQ